MVQQLVEKRPLEELLRGYFENYASDENLPAQHWFWDREKSGGIFIEHGVHFFDMFSGWLGAGEVVAAQRTLRPHVPLSHRMGEGSGVRASGIEEQVNCSVRYANGT